MFSKLNDSPLHIQIFKVKFHNGHTDGRWATTDKKEYITISKSSFKQRNADTSAQYLQLFSGLGVLRVSSWRFLLDCMRWMGGGGGVWGWGVGVNVTGAGTAKWRYSAIESICKVLTKWSFLPYHTLAYLNAQPGMLSSSMHETNPWVSERRIGALYRNDLRPQSGRRNRTERILRVRG